MASNRAESGIGVFDMAVVRASAAHTHKRKIHLFIDNSWKLLEGAAMSKVITAHFEQLIDKCIASGRFNNKSEVIRAGLRLLEEHEARNASASREDLSRVIQTALLDTRSLVPASSLVRRRSR